MVVVAATAGSDGLAPHSSNDHDNTFTAADVAAAVAGASQLLVWRRTDGSVVGSSVSRMLLGWLEASFHVWCHKSEDGDAGE